MNIDDVSNIPQYMAMLKQQKANIKRAQGLKGQKATPSKSRNEILAQFTLRRMMSSGPSPADKMNIRSSFLPPAYAPSTILLARLSKIMFRDLCLETHHRGRYILVRTVTPTDVMTAVMAIVEDEDERVLMIQIYNQGEEFSKFLDLPEGGCASDIILVPGFDERIPLSWRARIISVEEGLPAFWKERGNKFFEESRYHFAIQCYTKALECKLPPSPDLAIATQLNRALCGLRARQFDAALLDADAVLQRSEMSEKALFRKAQALYCLRKFRESCETHKVLGRNYPENLTAQHEYQRASARLAEEDTGEYEFKRMILEAKKRRPPHLERGTYFGPVTIKSTESHGRGLFTAEAVKAGDLLLCEKAFAYAFHDEKGSGDLTLLMSSDTNQMILGTQGQLIGMIAQKLYRNPSMLSRFIDLHHGTHDSFDIRVDGQVVVDTFLIQKTISLNGFGCPLLSRQSHIKSSISDDIAKDENKKFHSSGMWCMASYINHSCLSNTRRSFIGDMMIVRASRDIAKDTEITFWYQSPIGNQDEKLSDLQNWGFKCDCAICDSIRGLSKTVLSTRKRLSAELEKLFNSKKLKQAQIESTLASIEQTYSLPPSEVPYLALWSGYLSLAAISLTSHQFEKAIKFGLKCLESLGYVIEGASRTDTQVKVIKWGLMTDGVVGCWMILSRAFCEFAPSLKVYAEEYAKISYRICVGEDETFAT
ncbi:hypothetical protein N7462_005740 [Penicillium macrosclerotiorum]|uniref:uncharacterized protein n=1 Tax=Penicillium macrosclerotiorum TaxID=303699 RepID=UPI002546E438|nr:uncharacterized protein N7462_005740 [Penicillium macrosclerotiorum]KAJ5682575.1 hypothetical protein N7462_005740 [Penicillium macrosclerotiorum]